MNRIVTHEDPCTDWCFSPSSRLLIFSILFCLFCIQILLWVAHSMMANTISLMFVSQPLCRPSLSTYNRKICFATNDITISTYYLVLEMDSSSTWTCDNLKPCQYPHQLHRLWFRYHCCCLFVTHTLWVTLLSHSVNSEQDPYVDAIGGIEYNPTAHAFVISGYSESVWNETQRIIWSWWSHLLTRLLTHSLTHSLTHVLVGCFDFIVFLYTKSMPITRCRFGRTGALVTVC